MKHKDVEKIKESAYLLHSLLEKVKEDFTDFCKTKKVPLAGNHGTYYSPFWTNNIRSNFKNFYTVFWRFKPLHCDIKNLRL